MKVSGVLTIMSFMFFSARSQQFVHMKQVQKDTIRMAGNTLPATFAPQPTNEQSIPQNLYTQHLGFFCRQELKMQQAHVPVTFRLGSMDYCNWLEQKPGYR